MRIRVNRFAAILFLFIGIVVSTASAGVEISGVIAGDTTWTNTAAVIITGNVTVAAAGRLFIQPGTVIRFYPGTGLYVDGQLTADGQMADRIVFTSSADTVDGTPEAGGWNGVMFRQNAGGVLRNCDLRYGTKTVNIYKSSPTVDRCVIENFADAGIYINGYNSNPPITPLVENCRIGQHETNLRGTATGIYVHYLVDVVISNCAVSACNLGMDFEAYKLQAPHFQVTDCQISDHTASGIYAHAGG